MFFFYDCKEIRRLNEKKKLKFQQETNGGHFVQLYDYLEEIINKNGRLLF